jgi:hypothetical protein
MFLTQAESVQSGYRLRFSPRLPAQRNNRGRNHKSHEHRPAVPGKALAAGDLVRERTTDGPRNPDGERKDRDPLERQPQ